MKKLMIGLVAAALLPLSASVNAKTVCLSLFSGDAQMKLTVKPLKKPGTYSAITGIYADIEGVVGAMEGSAMVMTDGTIRLGMNLHTMKSPVISRDISWSAIDLDTKLQGSFSFDNTGDGAEDSATTATVISCKTFTLTPAL